MQKNLVMALVLSTLVYIFWYSFIMPPRVKAPPENVLPQTHENSAKKEKSVKPGKKPVLPAAELGETAIPAGPERTKFLKTGNLELELTSRGGGIKSAVYYGPVEPAQLIIDGTNPFLNSFAGWNFEFAKARDGEAVLRSRREGIAITKRYSFSPDNSLNTLSVKVKNLSGSPIAVPEWQLTMGPGIGTVTNEKKENPKQWKAKYAKDEEGRKHPSVHEIDESLRLEKPEWIGIDNRYFLLSILTRNLLESAGVNYSEVEIDGDEAPLLSVGLESFTLNPGDLKTFEIDFYIGPKDYRKLQKMGRGLDRSVDFGFFSPLAKIADSALFSLEKVTGNYGFAIVILSVLVQFLLFPLSMKSYKSMNAMKKLQPKMQYLQKKYKNEPKKLNAEMMELYKKEGVNPLSGCLPMLLQIPIFFALFTTLRNSWNLHGAEFIFWIKDLSYKDPYYVLPIVMGGIMLLQQFITPQTSGSGDPSQKFMKWMPVIFTVMFLNFPSGLVLYWLVNSLFSSAQQIYLVKKQI